MSETGSVFQILRALTPLASSLGKGKICGLMALTILMALSELVITGLVALLAAVLPNPLRFKANAPSGYVRSRQAWIMRQMRQLGGESFMRENKLY